jgi:hypothetical protein
MNRQIKAKELLESNECFENFSKGFETVEIIDLKNVGFTATSLYHNTNFFSNVIPEKVEIKEDSIKIHVQS